MTRLTRRELLENSMLAATALAVGAAGGPSPAADEQSSSPNERLRVAVLGLNGRGQDHLSGFMRRKDCQVVAVCDPDSLVGARKGVEVVEKATGQRPAYYQDLRKLFDHANSIDIVSIATPNHWHSLAAIWAMQIGKDVYVEKPISHNVTEGRRVVDAARKHNRICQTGTQSRSSSGTRELMAFLHNGGIGEISLARGLCYKRRDSIGPRGNYSVPESIDYDLWCGPAPMGPVTRPRFHYDWHWQWEYGNGDLGNQGIHQMDLARWGLGVADVGNAVVSYGGRLGYEDAGETANTQVSIHDFGTKSIVFEVRGLPTPDYKGAHVGVIFQGSLGYAVMASYDGGAVFDPEGNMLKKFSGGGDHYGNFISAVRSRKHEDLNADVLQGHLSSALCHLGNISYRLGQQVSAGDVRKRLEELKLREEALLTFDRFQRHLADNGVDLAGTRIRLGASLAIDPEKETFHSTMSEQANPMLTREYRKGFEVPATAALV